MDPSERRYCNPPRKSLWCPGTKDATPPTKPHTYHRSQSHSCSACPKTSDPDYACALCVPVLCVPTSWALESTPLRARQCPRFWSCCLYKCTHSPAPSSLAAQLSPTSQIPEQPPLWAASAPIPGAAVALWTSTPEPNFIAVPWCLCIRHQCQLYHNGTHELDMDPKGISFAMTTPAGEERSGVP